MNSIDYSMNSKVIDKVSPETMQNLCRTCLKELNQKQKSKILSLSAQIRQWLEDVNIENSDAYDFYPNSICLTCRNKLNKFWEFQEMFRQSTKTLQQILARGDFKFYEENTIKVEDPGYQKNIETEVKTESTLDITDMEEPLISCESLKSIEESNDLEDNSNIEDYYEKSDDQSDFGSSHSTKNYSEVTKVKRQKYKYIFRCKECECLCMSQQTLDIHMRIHYGLKPYKCPKCEESFDKSTFMLKHLYELHNETKLNIICEYKECGNQFSSYRSYKNHYREFHISQQTSKRHVCEECGKTYAKMQIFKEHLYTHGPKELYPFQCAECDKAFAKQTAFDEHKFRVPTLRS
ncbi:putative zinc finger protein 286B [Lucilia sericata]|uniref:putative zinc finger protein 286B n=1 Tax=Lucilia sericata TaxID=13632 RepID=UPI0018A83DAD|nr:putative zinc finger protein 286B [Lucilia sericata]